MLNAKKTLTAVAAAAIFLVVLPFLQKGQAGEENEPKATAWRTEPPAVRPERSDSRVRTKTAFRRPSNRKPGAPAGRQDPAQDERRRAMIAEIAAAFDVPAGILYGIWRKESGWLPEGWSRHWVAANSMTDPNGACRRHFRKSGGEKCLRHHRALLTICAQRRNGQPICDPNEVRVSTAGAMGPAQHMPGILIQCRSGTCRWAEHAVDYDGDGVFDPHRLPEALAAAARFVRLRHDSRRCRNDWGCAVNLYLGLGQKHYFYGDSRRQGVLEWWKRWCRSGNCA